MFKKLEDDNTHLSKRAASGVRLRPRKTQRPRKGKRGGVVAFCRGVQQRIKT